jgi:hypothetical protein
VAAVARNERRLADATQSLAAVGLDAKAYAADDLFLDTKPKIPIQDDYGLAERGAALFEG